jgi:hypothetical protein
MFQIVVPILALSIGGTLIAVDNSAPHGQSVPDTADQKPGDLLAVPDDKAQADALKTIKDLFTADYAKTDLSGMQSLAQKLLQQGIETTSDPASSYALLGEAIRLAAQAGDPDTAMKAAEAMSKTFKVDGISMKMEALAKAGAVITSPESCKSLIQDYTMLADQADNDDRYKISLQAITGAEAVARKVQDMSSYTSLQAKAKEIKELSVEFEKVKSSKAALLAKPDDPEANEALGRFLCFYKHQWDQGLPLLAKGKDEALKALAGKDLLGANDTNAKVALGDAWWDYSGKQKGITKDSSLRRSDKWYQEAIPSLAGLEKTKAEKRTLVVDGLGNMPQVWETSAKELGVSLGGEKLNPDHNFTLEFWVETVAVEGILITKRHQGEDSSLTLRLNGGTLSLLGDGGNYLVKITSPVIINDGEWHHIAVAKAGEFAELFVDGASQGKLKTLETFSSVSEWKLGYHGAWGNGALDAKFVGIRLSSSVRYNNEFQPSKNYGNDNSTLLFK